MTKILSERSILKKEDAFEVKEFELQFPNGRKALHYVAQRVDVSVVIPIDNKNNIYLIDQYRYLLKKRILEAVSGRVDQGERPIAAAKRELLEEAGISARSIEQLHQIELASSFFRARVFLYLAKDLEIGEQQLEDSEDILVVKMPIAQAIEKVINGEIQSASTIIGILLVDKLKQRRSL